MRVNSTIVRHNANEIQHGKLGESFQRGAKAILLEDHRAAWIWKKMAEFLPLSSSDSQLLSMQTNFFFRIANNHIDGSHQAGDMLRFTPGAIAHIARKILITRGENGIYKTVPSKFSDVPVPQDLVHTAWDFMTDILKSTYPPHLALPSYHVSIELLKYPNSYDEIRRIESLLRDSSGFWARIGMILDARKARATGLFDIKGIRDFTAIASLVPGLDRFLSTTTELMTRFSNKAIPHGYSLIGAPHCDGGKILTGLLSERATLSTEIHTGKMWETLPLTSDTLAIFPSAQINSHFGITPTLHRILIKDRFLDQRPLKSNLTLCLTAGLRQ